MRGRLVVAAVIALLIGVAVGWFVSGRQNETRLDRIIAMSWGDGKYGPAFYGAQVYLVPIASGYSVHARVHLGRGNNYFHDCGELGKASSDAEAVQKWGRIEWRPDGLHIGDYFLPQERIEAHR